MGETGILGPEERVELIDGEVVQMNPIGPPHSGRVARLNALLIRELGDRAVLFSQNPVHLGDFSMPQPDLMLLKARPSFYEDAHPQQDDVLLIIEVADSSVRYDRIVKLRVYARFGIPEYWIVNLPERCLEVYRVPVEEGYQEFQRFVAGDSVAPGAFPDFTLEAATLLGL